MCEPLLGRLGTDRLHQGNTEHVVVQGWLLMSQANNGEEAESHCNDG